MHLLGHAFEETRISAVHDVCLGAGRITSVLVSVTLEDGTHAILVADTQIGEHERLERLRIHETAGGSAARVAMMLNNATAPMRFEMDFDSGFYDVLIWIAQERYVIARANRTPADFHEWLAIGSGSSGAAALREFDRAGITLTVE